MHHSTVATQYYHCFTSFLHHGLPFIVITLPQWSDFCLTTPFLFHQQHNCPRALSPPILSFKIVSQPSNTASLFTHNSEHLTVKPTMIIRSYYVILPSKPAWTKSAGPSVSPGRCAGQAADAQTIAPLGPWTHGAIRRCQGLWVAGRCGGTKPVSFVKWTYKTLGNQNSKSKGIRPELHPFPPDDSDDPRIVKSKVLKGCPLLLPLTDGSYVVFTCFQTCVISQFNL